MSVIYEVRLEADAVFLDTDYGFSARDHQGSAGVDPDGSDLRVYPE